MRGRCKKKRLERVKRQREGRREKGDALTIQNSKIRKRKESKEKRK
jgi:hypothetical protein